MLWKPIEFTEYYSPDGVKFRFDNHSRFLISETGYGMPGVEYIDHKGPLQHGKTIYDYRLQPRVIQLLFRENGCDRQDYWDIRANILNLLRPNRQTTGFTLGTLRKITPNGAIRAIDVIIEEGPVFSARNASRWDEFSITETIRFIAPDPSFYNPTLITLSDTGPAIAGWTIVYPGTWLSHPTFVITGPMTDLVITNTDTSEEIDLSLYSIDAAEVVTIVTGDDNSVVSSTDGDIIGQLSSDSDLTTFHLAPVPEATGGSNGITIACAGTDGDSIAQIKYYVRYIGI
jgi:hypothetical protein